MKIVVTGGGFQPPAKYDEVHTIGRVYGKYRTEAPER